jgi:metal-responsive CopG/Arc/MetJ family transcriptional regulator
MDRVFSTRMDEDLVRRVDRFTRERSISKKGLIEKALREYLDRADPRYELDVIERSYGAWKRKESPEATWHEIRSAFNKGFGRHSDGR